MVSSSGPSAAPPAAAFVFANMFAAMLSGLDKRGQDDEMNHNDSEKGSIEYLNRVWIF